MGEKKAWHRRACGLCGTEGLASRTVPRDVDERYLCDGCEVHEQYKDHASEAEVQELKSQVSRLRDVVEHVAGLAQEECPLCTLADGEHEGFCGMSRLLPGDIAPTTP